MGRYYTVDSMSTWNIMDPDFPEELPEVGERVYVAIVDGPLNKDSEKVFADTYTLVYQGLDWLKAWYSMLKKDQVYGNDVIIIWVAIPPAPKLPAKWRICGPTICEDEKCDHYDNGYCLGGNKKCKKGYIHREFSRRDW